MKRGGYVALVSSTIVSVRQIGAEPTKKEWLASLQLTYLLARSLLIFVEIKLGVSDKFTALRDTKIIHRPSCQSHRKRLRKKQFDTYATAEGVRGKRNTNLSQKLPQKSTMKA